MYTHLFKFAGAIAPVRLVYQTLPDVGPPEESSFESGKGKNEAPQGLEDILRAFRTGTIDDKVFKQVLAESRTVADSVLEVSRLAFTGAINKADVLLAEQKDLQAADVIQAACGVYGKAVDFYGTLVQKVKENPDLTNTARVASDMEALLRRVQPQLEAKLVQLEPKIAVANNTLATSVLPFARQLLVKGMSNFEQAAAMAHGGIDQQLKKLESHN